MTRLLLPLCLLAAPALAHDFAAGDLRIAHPYAFATPPGAPVAGGYMAIENIGATEDRLLGIRVDPSVAGAAVLHEMTMQGDVMRMREVERGLPLPAGATVALAPGGLHVMFTGLPDRFAEGEKVAATLSFERAGEVEVVFTVERRGAAPDHAEGHGGGTMDHGGAAHGTDGADGGAGGDG